MVDHCDIVSDSVLIGAAQRHGVDELTQESKSLNDLTGRGISTLGLDLHRPTQEVGLASPREQVSPQVSAPTADCREAPQT